MKLLPALATLLLAATLPATGAPRPDTARPAVGASSWAGHPHAQVTRSAADLMQTSATAASSVQPVPSPTIITTAPYTITKSGYYQLGADLTYAGNNAINNDAIITINTSNVTLDFAGHFISGPSGQPATSLYGVYANERGNLVIENGTIAYCYYGIALRGNGQAGSININQRVDHMLATFCYYVGISLEEPRNSAVTNCGVSSIGTSGSSSAYGLEIFAGTGNKALNNTITTITATDGTAYGLSGGGAYYASGNVITDVTTGSGGAYGIYNPLFAVHNAISNAVVGISGGKYQDNLTNNCTTPFADGTDAGGNN